MLPFSVIIFFVIAMFNPPLVFLSCSIVVPSPSFLFYPGTPVKVEIFFSFPPVGLRIHGEVSHNETWEHWQPAVGGGQVGTDSITKEPPRTRSVLQQHVPTAVFKDYGCPSAAAVFLNESPSLGSVCVCLALDVGLT